MTYEEWEMGVPIEIRSDTLWKMKAYRLGLFFSDLAWEDASVLLAEPRSRSTADQLYRAASNISSNFSEGYSPPERVEQSFTSMPSALRAKAVISTTRAVALFRVRWLRIASASQAAS